MYSIHCGNVVFPYQAFERRLAQEGGFSRLRRTPKHNKFKRHWTFILYIGDIGIIRGFLQFWLCFKTYFYDNR
jgi:hypothetical protein